MLDKDFNLKDFIKTVIQSQINLNKELKFRLDEGYSDESIIKYFENVNSGIYMNSAISCKVADLCQLLNEENNFKDISLDQIRIIYEAIIDIHPYDLSFYESLAYYLINVLDKPEDAKKVLTEGVSKIEDKMNSLKEILQKIE